MTAVLGLAVLAGCGGDQEPAAKSSEESRTSTNTDGSLSPSTSVSLDPQGANEQFQTLEVGKTVVFAHPEGAEKSGAANGTLQKISYGPGQELTRTVQATYKIETLGPEAFSPGTMNDVVFEAEGGRVYSIDTSYCSDEAPAQLDELRPGQKTVECVEYDITDGPGHVIVGEANHGFRFAPNPSSGAGGA